MPFAQVTNLDDVANLPDGTLIRWQAVPGDLTSSAVAYLRKELQYTGIREDEEAGIHEQKMVAWISPGNGWQPEDLDLLVLPVEVILTGISHAGDYVPNMLAPDIAAHSFVDRSALSAAFADAHATEWPDQTPLVSGLANVTDFGTQTLISGGTYPRDVALQAAATVFQGNGRHLHDDTVAGYVTALADGFIEWLNDGYDSDAVDPDDPTYQLDDEPPAHFTGGTQAQS